MHLWAVGTFCLSCTPRISLIAYAQYHASWNVCISLAWPRGPSCIQQNLPPSFLLTTYLWTFHSAWWAGDLHSAHPSGRYHYEEHVAPKPGSLAVNIYVEILAANAPDGRKADDLVVVARHLLYIVSFNNRFLFTEGLTRDFNGISYWDFASHACQK